MAVSDENNEITVLTCKVLCAKCCAQNPACKVQCAKCRVPGHAQSAVHRIMRAKSCVQSAESWCVQWPVLVRAKACAIMVV